MERQVLDCTWLSHHVLQSICYHHGSVINNNFEYNSVSSSLAMTANFGHDFDCLGEVQTATSCMFPLPPAPPHPRQPPACC